MNRIYFKNVNKWGSDGAGIRGSEEGEWFKWRARSRLFLKL